MRLLLPTAQSAALGALPEVYAAVGADTAGSDFVGPGGFQESRGLPKKVLPSARVRDAEVARRLWTVSEGLTGVTSLN